MEKLLFAIVCLIALIIFTKLIPSSASALFQGKKTLSLYIFKRLFIVVLLIIGLIVWITTDMNNAKQRNEEYLLEQETEQQELESWETWKEHNADRVIKEAINNKCYDTQNDFYYRLPDFLVYDEYHLNQELDLNKLIVNEFCFSDSKITLTLPLEYEDEYQPNIMTNKITYDFVEFTNNYEEANYQVYEQPNKSSYDTITINLKELEKYMYDEDQSRPDYMRRINIAQNQI